MQHGKSIESEKSSGSPRTRKSSPRKVWRRLKEARAKIRKLRQRPMGNQKRIRQQLACVVPLARSIDQDKAYRKALVGVSVAPKSPAKRRRFALLALLRFLGLGQPISSAYRYADAITACLQAPKLKKAIRLLRRRGAAYVTRTYGDAR